MSLTRGRQKKARRVARLSVNALLRAAIEDTSDEIYAGTGGMERNELEVFRKEVLRIADWVLRQVGRDA